MSPSPRRVIGYARVSSKEQAIGTSLEDQQEVIRRYAQAQGMTVERMYVEAASAVHEKIERREKLQALMADVREGDLVLVDKVDRWSRDPELTYRTMRQLVERKARAFFIGDNIDPSTADGDTALNFRVMFAREEHKRIKARLVGTRRGLRNRGYYVEGIPPLGYARQDTKGLAKNVLLVVEENAAIVRRMFRLCAAGSSLGQIAAQVGVDFTRVGKMIRTRVYLGEIRNTSGEWIRGQHPAIVTAAQWVAANDALAARRHGWSKGVKADSRTAGWWLRDVARCGKCGAKMTASYGQTQSYFGCRARCGAPYVRYDVAEAECEPLVVARLSAMAEELAAPPTTDAAPVIDLVERNVRLVAKRARTVDLFADGAIDRLELRARLAAIDAERSKLEALAAVSAPSPADRLAALKRVGAVARAWGKRNGVTRREVVRLLIVSVALARDEAPRITWASAEELQKESVG